MEKTRTPFGRRLFEARKKAKLTQQQVREKIGISQGTLSELETDAHGSSYTPALAELYGVSALYLAEGKGSITLFGKQEVSIDEQEEFIPIKRVDIKINAGISGFAIEDLNGERAPIFFRKDWINRRGYRPEMLHAIEVKGQSMEFSLFEGDLVVINLDETKPIDGEVFAANYEGELVIKRMVNDAGHWYLASDNQDKRRFPNKLAHEQCFIIGRIIYKQSERI